MSAPRKRNKDELGEGTSPPTASFDGSTAGPGGQIGPFRIERQYGQGAVGVVHLAHDTALDISATEQVFRDNYVATDYQRARNYDIAEDGRFPMVKEIDNQPPSVTELNIVINWHKVLEDLCP